MNQNLNNEVEVEEVYSEFFGVNNEFSQDYLDFLYTLEVAPVIFDANDIIDEFTSNPYQENWWEEPINEENETEELIDFNCQRIYASEVLDYLSEEHFWDDCNNDYDFPQPESKYLKVSSFELIPQKKYINF